MPEPQFVAKPAVASEDFHRDLPLPYGLTVETIKATMEEVYHTLHIINLSLVQAGLSRLEETMLGNSFSGLISELIVKALPKYSHTLVRNVKVGGHPDLIPIGKYSENSVLSGDEGIEVKASMQASGWQGHNPEAGWIMIWQYTKDEITQPIKNRNLSQFQRVLIARLEKEDWSFSGRKGQSRRTPTASILKSGTQKLLSQAVYELGRPQLFL